MLGSDLSIVSGAPLREIFSESLRRSCCDFAVVLGISRFRRQLEARNRDRVIVFCGDHFGIFRNHEVFLLVGIAVRERALMGESAQTVLARYRTKRDTS